MKIIIIGGVAGGATAAARLRRLDEHSEITIYERSGYISYANCGLPYYIGDVINDEKKLTLQTPNSFYKRFNVNVKVNHEVIDINPENKEITIVDLINKQTIKDKYDKLIIATGAKSLVPPFIKITNRVHTLKTVEDAFKIKQSINELKPKNALIIGGGYVGIEMAEALANLNIKTSIVQLDKSLLSIIDFDMASFIHTECLKNNVDLYLGKKVEDVCENKDEIIVKLDDGNIIKTDLIILAVGIQPESALAKKAGLKLGTKDSIKTNEYMQTSNADIYAVGDVAEINHLISKDKKLISLAGPANKQARIAADHIYGLNRNYQGAQGTSIVKVFGLTVATTGLNEKECIEKGIKYEKVILSPTSHAGYYPNALVLTIKVIYDLESKKIKGSTIIGYDGVDKRIDVLATAIFAGLNVNLLKDLDLAYAPPYSSAKDPINLAGCIIDNIEQGLVKQFYYEDLEYLRTKDVILLDTRTPFEYEKGYAKGFINIPLDDLRNRISELDKSKPVYVMCQSGLRSYIATRILVQNGFDAYNFAGGYRLYSSIESSNQMTKKSFQCGIDK